MKKFEEKLNEWLKKEMKCMIVIILSYCLFKYIETKINSDFGDECLYILSVIMILFLITGYVVMLLNTYYMITETSIYKKYKRYRNKDDLKKMI